MVELVKAPKIEMPDWLLALLIMMNWDILGYRLYIGNSLRLILIWLIEILDNINTSADDASIYLNNKIDGMTATLVMLITGLTGMVGALETKVDAVDLRYKNAVASIVFTLNDLVINYIGPTTRLAVALSERVQIMSVDIDDLREEVATPWWDPVKIIEGIAELLSPLKKDSTDVKNLFEWLWLFFLDPPLFLYEVVDEIIDRFW